MNWRSPDHNLSLTQDKKLPPFVNHTGGITFKLCSDKNSYTVAATRTRPNAYRLCEAFCWLARKFWRQAFLPLQIVPICNFNKVGCRRKRGWRSQDRRIIPVPIPCAVQLGRGGGGVTEGHIFPEFLCISEPLLSRLFWAKGVTEQHILQSLHPFVNLR